MRTAPHSKQLKLRTKQCDENQTVTGGSDYREICIQKIIVTIFSPCLDGPKLGTRHGAALAYAGTLGRKPEIPTITNLFRDKSWLHVGS